MAAGTGDTAEANRLFTAILKDNCADNEAVRALVDLLVSQNNPLQAQKVVAEALKAKPEDRQFTSLRDRLLITTPEALRKYQDETVAAITDPLLRALDGAE